MKTIDIVALEWFDKINGNSYFAATVTLDFGTDQAQSFKLPSSITAVGTLDKPRLIAQTLPVPIVGYTLLAAVILLLWECMIQ